MKLRVHGLTSTLLSGKDGKDDVQGSLYLGPRQTVLDPAPNTANMVLVHHPIDWLVDGDAVDDALTGRAAFHLFGHKHKQRAVMADTYVCIGAGAINPSRAEQPYLPGYNLIELQVAGAGVDRHIAVSLHQRRLQDNPEVFAPIQTQQKDTVFRARIPVPEEDPLPVIGSGVPIAHASGHALAPAAGSEATEALDAEAAMGEPDTRDLLFRFWRLTSGQRRTIALELNLLERDELKLPEPERYGRALLRAGERNLIKEVAVKVKLADAVNGVDVEWAKAASGSDLISPVTTPIHFALEQRSEMNSTDAWQSGWSNLTGVSADAQLPNAKLSELFYREHVFLNVGS